MDKQTKTTKTNKQITAADWIILQLSKARGTAWEYRSRKFLLNNCPTGRHEADRALFHLERDSVIVMRTVQASIIVYKLNVRKHA